MRGTCKLNTHRLALRTRSEFVCFLLCLCLPPPPMCMRKPEANLGCCSLGALQSLTALARPTGQWGPGILMSSFPRLWDCVYLLLCSHHTQTLCGHWGLSLVTHTCTASTVPIKSSLQFLFFLSPPLLLFLFFFMLVGIEFMYSRQVFFHWVAFPAL